MSVGSSWHFPPFHLDTVTSSLWREKELVSLAPKPFAVLAHLVSHAGEVVSKEDLLDAVWPETVVTEGVLKGCIRQIRQVLGETAQAPQFITTMHRRGYRFIAPVTTASSSEQEIERDAPTEPATACEPPPFVVGRESELKQLHEHFGRARSGERQVVYLTGEAGIGKTTLVDFFLAQVASETSIWRMRGQCIEQHGAGEAYLPLLEALSRFGRGSEGNRLIEILRRHAPSWLIHLPALVSTEELKMLLQHSFGINQQRMLRELAEAVESVAAEHPLLIVLEDLHWSDVSTVEWLAYMSRRRDWAQLMVIGTYRPVEAIVLDHPLRTMTQELQQQGQVAELMLSYLTEEAISTYLTQRFAAAALPAGLAPLLHQRTNGNPFFLVSMLGALMEQQARHQDLASAWRLPEDLTELMVEVPRSLRQLIERQLAQCDPMERRLLEAASVMGREFVVNAVALSLEQPQEEAEECLAALARRGQFIRSHGLAEWRDGTISGRFGFIHDVYRETLYEQVAWVRRIRLHRQIGLRLEAGYGTQTPEIAAELGEHFIRGRDAERAVTHLLQAGENARRRSALQEATTHLQRGVGLLAALPISSTRLERELALHFTLGLVLSNMKGQAASETGQAYTRAHELCQELGDDARQFQILAGLRRFYSGRGDLQTAQALAKQLHTLARRSGDPEQIVEARMSQGLVSFFLGDRRMCRHHAERGLAQDIPQPHHSPTLVRGTPHLGCLCYAAMALWGLGYPDQAMQQMQNAMRLAQDGGRPDSLAFVLQFATHLRQFRRESKTAQRLAAEGRHLAQEQALGHWLAPFTILHGWAVAVQGQPEAGLTEIEHGLDLVRSMEAKLQHAYYLSLLAEARGMLSQFTTGLENLELALKLAHQLNEYWHEAELYRLKGEFLLQQGHSRYSVVEDCFYQALHTAKQQQAKSLELRAAISLSRLWKDQDKQTEARELLTPIYDWFSEGYDTHDLKEAQTLLIS